MTMCNQVLGPGHVEQPGSLEYEDKKTQIGLFESPDNSPASDLSLIHI